MSFKDRVQEYILEELDARIAREGTVSRHPLDISHDNPIPFGVAKGTATAIHKSPDYALDEVYLYAANRSADDAFLTMSFQDPDASVSDLDSIDEIIITPIKSKMGLALVLPGNPVSDKTLYVQASATDSINIIGYIFRYYRNHEFDDDEGFHHGEG